jgi:uncharacterized protein YjbI with pentapeptide repeats
MPPQRTKRGTMTQQELDTILKSHEKWLATAARDEGPADLSNLDLRGLDFRGVSLKKAILRKSDLSGVDLHEMDLSGADLSLAELIGCNLRGAVLRDAHLRGAKLKDAQLCDADLCGAILHEVNLTNAHGLVESQFAGTDLSNAELPADLGKFVSLAKVADVSVQARTLLWVTLGACLFSIITMFVTTDSAIVARAGSAKVPVVEFNVPILVFFSLAPLVLLGLYLYLHFQLQYLWTGLASLPSVFPDGATLDERAYPLFLVGLVRWYVPILKKRRPPLCWLQVASSFASVWALVPVTLFLFWLRYARMHETWETIWHILVLMAATGLGAATYSLTVQTLGGERNPVSEAGEHGDRKRTPAGIGLRMAAIAGAFVVMICALVSIAAFKGWMVNTGYLREWTSPDIRYGEISHKPDDWQHLSLMEAEELSRVVRGARLQGANLRGAKAYGSFFVNAELTGARLQKTDFSEADLRVSVLNGAHLQQAWLGGTDLSGASLEGAELQCANLKSAKLVKARLHNAKLNGANLYGADLQKANLVEAELSTDAACCAALTKIAFPNGDCAKTILCGAQLQGADLTGAKLQQADLGYCQMQGASLQDANLTRAKLRKADLNNVDFSGAWFQETELQGADLSQAKNLDEKQLSGASYDGDTKLPPGLEKKATER